jgi:hypothetical protein
LKKAPHEQPPRTADFPPSGNEESESEADSIINVPILSQEIISGDDVDTDIAVEHIDGKELSDLTVPDEQRSMVWSFTKTFKTKLIICVWTILLSFSFFLSTYICVCIYIFSLSLSLFFTRWWDSCW